MSKPPEMSLLQKKGSISPKKAEYIFMYVLTLSKYDLQCQYEGPLNLQ